MIIDKEAVFVSFFIAVLTAVVFMSCSHEKKCEMKCEFDKFDVPICKEVCE